MGCVMAGFISGGSSWGGSIVSRVGADGCVWSVRAPSAVRGPVSPSLCVPFTAQPAASAWARQVARLLGWRVSVRRAKRSAGPFEVKVVLPWGLSAAQARQALQAVR